MKIETKFNEWRALHTVANHPNIRPKEFASRMGYKEPANKSVRYTRAQNGSSRLKFLMRRGYLNTKNGRYSLSELGIYRLFFYEDDPEFEYKLRRYHD